MLNHSYWNSKEPNGIEPAEKPHEECGVFGLYGDDVMPPAYAAYNGLLALQHRGQESCGIAVNDRGVVSYHKDMGLVSEVFHPGRIWTSFPGRCASAMCGILPLVTVCRKTPSLW